MSKQFKVQVSGKVVGFIRAHVKTKKGVSSEGFIAILNARVPKADIAKGDRTPKAHKANVNSALAWLLGVAVNHKVIDAMPLTQADLVITEVEYSAKKELAGRYALPAGIKFEVSPAAAAVVQAKARAAK
jgi:hypothetical protein